MTPTLLAETETLALELADAAVRLGVALAEGDLDTAVAALDEHGRLQSELQPRLAALHHTSQAAATDARDRIAELLQCAFESTRAGEASLRQSMDQLQARIGATRRQSATAAGYGAVDIPVSSGFQRTG
jgi:hypothetical protein